MFQSKTTSHVEGMPRRIKENQTAGHCPLTAPVLLEPMFVTLMKPPSSRSRAPALHCDGVTVVESTFRSRFVDAGTGVARIGWTLLTRFAAALTSDLSSGESTRRQNATAMARERCTAQHSTTPASRGLPMIPYRSARRLNRLLRWKLLNNTNTTKIAMECSEKERERN